MPVTQPTNFHQRLLTSVLLFMSVFALVTLLNEHVTQYKAGTNQAVYADTRCCVAAAQKVKLGQDLYLQADTSFTTREVPQVWERMDLKPGLRVYPYIYPPLLAELPTLFEGTSPRTLTGRAPALRSPSGVIPHQPPRQLSQPRPSALGKACSKTGGTHPACPLARLYILASHLNRNPSIPTPQKRAHFL